VGNDFHDGAAQELRRGWRIILTSSLGCGLGHAALIFYTFGLFIDPIGQEFGWTRGEVSSIYSFGSVSVLLACPAMGWIVDRVGFRRVALVSVPLLAAMLFAVSRMDGSLAGFRFAFAVIGLVGLGTTPVVYTRIVNENFNAARGLALGLTLVGVGLAAILLPPAVSRLIAVYGWRSGFALLSVLAIIPWGFVLATTGRTSISAGATAKTHTMTAYMAALKSPILWRLGFGFFVMALSVSGLFVHMVPILTDFGVTPGSAVATASLMGFGVILGRVIAGWLLDRVFAPYLVSCLLLIAATGVVFLAQGGAAFATFAALLMGFVLGAEVDLIAYLTARYFRIESYSFLFAILYTCFVLGAGNGAGMVGLIFDATGSYHVALWVVAALFALSALIFGTFPKYQMLRPEAAIDQPVGASLAG
jgi:predicted MFS family arabinose efflux permease